MNFGEKSFLKFTEPISISAQIVFSRITENRFKRCRAFILKRKGG